MAEISRKRSAREMDESNISDHEEQEIKAVKTNGHRRRSSFARGIFLWGILCELYVYFNDFFFIINRKTTTTGASETIWKSVKLWSKRSGSIRI